MARSIMKQAVAERVLSQLEENIESIRVVVLYHGGEPFLNKHFLKILARVKRAGVPYVKTDTNGMFLTDAMIEGLVREGLDLISFSTDGDSPEISDLIRRKSDYRTIVTNIKRLLEHKRRAGSEKPAVKIANASFVDPKSYTGGDPHPPRHLLDEFADYAEEVSIVSHWIMRWPQMGLDETLYGTYDDPFDDVVDSAYCDHVHHTMTVRWNGDVVACCYDLTSTLVLGNVMSEDLTDVWNGRRYLELRRSLAQRAYVPTCANCNVVRRNVYLHLKTDDPASPRS